MNNITVPYEIIIEKELDIDLDEIIDAVIEDIQSDGDEVNSSTLEYTFADNIGYYLEKLGLIYDSDVLTNNALDYIYDEYMEAITKKFPEFYDN